MPVRPQSASASPAAAQHANPLEANAARLRLVEVNLHKGHLALDADRIELASGIRFTGGELLVDALAIDHLTVTIDELGARRSRAAQDTAAQDTAAQDTEPAPKKWLSPWLDPNVFDRVNGRLHLDVTVDAKVPVIGRRVGTHKFRLPIEDGVFDYLRLERGMSLLEDAVLDFTVHENNLVLCRNLPIIGLRKDLVRWPLDDRELSLAKERRLIRLRTLPKFIITGTGNKNKTRKEQSNDHTNKEKDREKSFQLNGIEVKNIDIELSASANSDTESGSRSAISALSMEQCNITGALRYPGDTPQTVTVRAQSLAAQLRDLPLGKVNVHRGQVSIDKLVEARVTFAGLRPSALVLTFEGVRIQDAVVAINRQSDSPPREPSR